MARARSNYIDAAVQVLEELGGGPLSSKDLVKAAQERGLIGTTQYVYHNFLRKVRESDLFDTSVRGQVSLTAPGSGPIAEETPAEQPDGLPVAPAMTGGAPAAVISEILGNDLPETNALDDVEDEEIDPDEVQVNNEF